MSEAINLNQAEKQKLDDYFERFVDKFFKIYKKLNVKIVSIKVLQDEMSPKGDKGFLALMDSVSGNLNKVSNHVSLFLRENDLEIS
jgi:hypothetical protein